MNEQIVLTIAGIVGGSGGIFALIKYIISAHEKNQRNFLQHLEIKNGTTERIANKFSDTIEKFNITLNNLEIKNEIAHQRLFDELRK